MANNSKVAFFKMTIIGVVRFIQVVPILFSQMELFIIVYDDFKQAAMGFKHFSHLF